MAASAGSAQIASLSNVDLDVNGDKYLKSAPEITFVGKTRLSSTYISDKRDIPIHAAVTFDIVGFEVTQYVVDARTKAVIAPIRATELVTLNGTSDQSLYAYNVRGPLGRTQVNRDIVSSINDQSLHKLFPLFHNGITVICRQLEISDEHRFQRHLIVALFFGLMTTLCFVAAVTLLIIVNVSLYAQVIGMSMGGGLHTGVVIEDENYSVEVWLSLGLLFTTSILFTFFARSCRNLIPTRRMRLRKESEERLLNLEKTLLS